MNNILTLEQASPIINSVIDSAIYLIELVTNEHLTRLEFYERLSDCEWLFLMNDNGTDCVDIEEAKTQINRIKTEIIKAYKQEREEN